MKPGRLESSEPGTGTSCEIVLPAGSVKNVSAVTFVDQCERRYYPGQANIVSDGKTPDAVVLACDIIVNFEIRRFHDDLLVVRVVAVIVKK